MSFSDAETVIQGNNGGEPIHPTDANELRRRIEALEKSDKEMRGGHRREMQSIAESLVQINDRIDELVSLKKGVREMERFNRTWRGAMLLALQQDIDE